MVKVEGVVLKFGKAANCLFQFEDCGEKNVYEEVLVLKDQDNKNEIRNVLKNLHHLLYSERVECLWQEFQYIQYIQE